MTDLGRNINRVLDNLDLSEQIPLPSDDSIPTDLQEFYADMGYLQHPDTRKEVKALAPYQLEVWRAMQMNKRVLVA